MMVQEEAFGALMSWVKGIHNYRLCAFDLTATEWTTLTIRFLEQTRERIYMKQDISCFELFIVVIQI